MVGLQTHRLWSREATLSSFPPCLCVACSFVFLAQVVFGPELLAVLKKLGSQRGVPRAQIKIVKSGAVVEGEGAVPAPASST